MVFDQVIFPLQTVDKLVTTALNQTLVLEEFTQVQKRNLKGKLYVLLINLNINGNKNFWLEAYISFR